jgi:hypothetical protein
LTPEKQNSSSLKNNSEYTMEDVSDLFKDLDKSELSEYMFETNEKNHINLNLPEIHKSQTDFKEQTKKNKTENDFLLKLKSFHYNKSSTSDSARKKEVNGLNLNEPIKIINRSISLKTTTFDNQSPIKSIEITRNKFPNLNKVLIFDKTMYLIVKQNNKKRTYKKIDN